MTNKKITRAIDKFKEAATNIAISQRNDRESTKIAVRPKPTMFPKSPLADQMPIALPSDLISKCSLVRVSRVGQAGN